MNAASRWSYSAFCAARQEGMEGRDALVAGLANGRGGACKLRAKRTICAARAWMGLIQVGMVAIANQATPTMVPQPKILSGIAGLRTVEWRDGPLPAGLARWVSSVPGSERCGSLQRRAWAGAAGCEQRGKRARTRFQLSTRTQPVEVAAVVECVHARAARRPSLRSQLVRRFLCVLAAVTLPAKSPLLLHLAEFLILSLTGRMSAASPLQVH